MSTGMGSGTSAFRCITIPTGFCSLTALCAARIARGRVSATGNTIPGNRTMPRTGTMMSESDGSGGVGAAPKFSSAAIAACVSAIARLRLLQRYQQATVGGRSMNSVVASDGKTYATFETALWKLQAMDGRGPDLRWIGPNPRDDNLP